jgi:hypothetical protein
LLRILLLIRLNPDFAQRHACLGGLPSVPGWMFGAAFCRVPPNFPPLARFPNRHRAP